VVLSAEVEEVAPQGQPSPEKKIVGLSSSEGGGGGRGSELGGLREQLRQLVDSLRAGSSGLSLAQVP
jgi:hypothetical protein